MVVHTVNVKTKLSSNYERGKQENTRYAIGIRGFLHSKYSEE